MFQDSTNKWWFPATITSICSEPRSYKMTTKEGVTYRKAQSHLSHITHSARNMKMNIIHCNLAISSQIISQPEGVTYRKAQSHLSHITPQCKKHEDEHYTLQSSNMQTVKSYHSQYKTTDNLIQSYSRPKGDIKPPVKLYL